MASFPKKPSPKAAPAPANDPMLDAIRHGAEDEPHFGASPGAVQAANAVLMANIRNKLGPAFNGGKKAAPTIEMPHSSKSETSQAHALQAETVPESATVPEPENAAALTGEEANETIMPAPPHSIGTLLEPEAALLPPEPSPQPAAAQEAGASALAESEPVYRPLSAMPSMDAPDFGEEAWEEKAETALSPERISPASARVSSLFAETSFDADATTSEQAARAFPQLQESEFREIEEPLSAAPSFDPAPRAPSNSRWRWVLAACALLGMGAIALLMRDAETETPTSRPATMARPAAAPTPLVADGPALVLPEPATAPSPVPAPTASALPPVAEAPPARIAPPAMAPSPAPAAPPAGLDPQRILRLLSRP